MSSMPFLSLLGHHVSDMCFAWRTLLGKSGCVDLGSEIREMVSLALESNLPILPKDRPSENKNQLTRDLALAELVNRFINHEHLAFAQCGNIWSAVGCSLNALLKTSDLCTRKFVFPVSPFLFGQIFPNGGHTADRQLRALCVIDYWSFSNSQTPIAHLKVT